MAENIYTNGDTATLVAPANVNSGQFVVVGNLRGVALTSATSGGNVACQMRGEATLPKPNAASTAFAAGANVHWDATNAVVTGSATSNAKVGAAIAAASNTDTSVRVYFYPE